MKCKCENCNGRGHIVCEDCGGSGESEQEIERISLDSSAMEKHPNLAELKALQADAARCRVQAEQLAALNPARASSYAEQLRGTLKAIDRMATKAFENNGKKAARI